MKPVYFDYAATTPCDPEVVAAMLPYFSDRFGNPGSMHAFGQKTKGAVEEAREGIAAFLGADSGEIVFTSGGTESNNMAVKGAAYARRGKGNHIITSQIEHHAVLEPCHFLEKEGFEVTILPVDGDGRVDPDDVRRAITDKTILISIMHANNEIGTIQPIAEIGKMARERGVYFHTDAVQTLGHLPFTVNDLNVDLLSASAHKLYGPKGVGLLYVRKGTRLTPFMHGGEQENKRRASTHNVPGIIGFGKAVEMAQGSLEKEVRDLIAWRDKLIRGFQEKIDQVKLNGDPTRRLPNNVNISIAHVEGEGMLLSLDMLGIACSTGSACSSASLAPSHVLMAIGLPHELAHGSLRFSMGRPTTAADVDRLLEVLPPVVAKLRAMSPLYHKT
ncbi:MAG: cysteine desulfurase NifS [Syntrophales bacterium]|jgi:cysteine desulfurase|nr:cysteine desulfurase NifS [Syntrophales bacterium]MCK9392521.1 cysteine desulfurase NifS [Syntrophales bacterium]